MSSPPPALVLWKKELVDALRDRRTLAMMVLVPIALYPVMMFAMAAIMSAGMSRLAKEQIQVALVDDEAARVLPAEAAPPKTAFVRMTRGAAEEAIREGKRVGAAVELEAGAREDFLAGRPMKGVLLYTQRHDFSLEAKDRMRRALEKRGIQFVERRLADAHLPPSYAQALDVDNRDIDFDKDLGPLVASHLLPMILLMMLFLGSFYAAIDVTAGEKERGTLETLLVAPVRPIEVMLGKYLAVSTIAVVATVVNLGAMVTTFQVGFSLGGGASISVALSGRQLAIMLACLLPAALLVSALSLAVASLAKSYKEGQSVLTPLLLIGIAPGIAAQMPGVELSDATALVPLVNVALVIKAVVLGNVTALQLFLTMGSIGLFAALAIWIASNAFQSEAIRFGGLEAWRDLFRRS